jgi:hypothetical protein
MLQANELYSRFRSIVQTIDIASDACMSDESVPPELRRSVLELDQESERAKQVLASADRRRIVQAIDELDAFGDRAARACKAADALHPDLKQAVLKAHDALADLREQLH